MPREGFEATVERMVAPRVKYNACAHVGGLSIRPDGEVRPEFGLPSITLANSRNHVRNPATLARIALRKARNERRAAR